MKYLIIIHFIALLTLISACKKEEIAQNTCAEVSVNANWTAESSNKKNIFATL